MMRGECENSWASHSVQVMVEWPDTPQAPWLRDSWLCVAHSRRLGQQPRVCSALPPGVWQVQQPVDDRGLQGVRPWRAQPWEKGAHCPGADPVSTQKGAGHPSSGSHLGGIIRITGRLFSAAAVKVLIAVFLKIADYCHFKLITGVITGDVYYIFHIII